jgi:hypothetical protein
MPYVLAFRFDELPLVQQGPLAAADVSGTAEIVCHPGGGWRLRRIKLDGFRRLEPSSSELESAARQGRAVPRFMRAQIELEQDDPIFVRVRHLLTHPWRDHVDDEVMAHLSALRRASSDQRADHNRKLKQLP